MQNTKNEAHSQGKELEIRESTFVYLEDPETGYCKEYASLSPEVKRKLDAITQEADNLIKWAKKLLS